jgi:phosphoribosyl-ATP pyrophosphohydrolase/phosphoribosyl-AMP cyclohydrolase
MGYSQKNIIATIYLKNGASVRSFKDDTPDGDLYEKIRIYNDNGIDKIYLFDLSSDDEEHELNLHTMKEINRISEIPVYAGGNINRLEDVKKILYAGCKKAILNAEKDVIAQLAKESALRFGKEKLAITVNNVDLLFKKKSDVEESISEILVLGSSLAGIIGDVSEMPYSILQDDMDFDKIKQVLTSEQTITGVSSNVLSKEDSDILALKEYLAKEGIPTGHLQTDAKWSEFKLNEDGLIPVIAQDYRTNEVLMLAYMNEEAFYTTLSLGKMTYYSRSRQELWTKGVTSGHFQYVKSLSIDCDKDTILAKVSQVGAACHTGNHSCFYTDLVKEESPKQNPQEVFEREYNIILDRKKNPKEGSYTNYLFDKGIDKILKKVGEEATEIVIAAKNPDAEEIKYEIADFLYHMMVMMVEKGISWDEVLEELSQR